MEQLWLSVKVPNANDLMLCALYIPPDKSKSANILQSHLYPTVATACALSNCVIIIGDFNMQFTQKGTQRLIINDFMAQFSLDQLILEPTHTYIHDGTLKKSLIDLLFVSQDVKAESSSVELTDISDHDMIWARLNLQKEPVKESFVKFRSMKSFDPTKFIYDLYLQPWEQIFEENSVNNKARLFSDYFTNALNLNAPFKVVKKRTKYCPWMTNECKEAKREKFQWLKQFRRTNNFIAQIMWKHYKSKERRLLRQAEKDFYNNQLQRYAKDPKKVWNVINGLIPRKQKDHIPADVNCHFLAESYNQHFVNVGKTVSDKAKALAMRQGFDISQELHDKSIRQDGHIFNLKTVSERETKEVILRMKDQKSPGIDGIKPYFLKVSLPITLPVITNIFNCSIRTGNFPDEWKVAKVIPLQKIRGNLDSVNQRPISLLPIISKAFERIILIQFISFLERSESISPNQHGARPRHSTETALLALTEDILKAIDEKKVTALMSFDATKAYDSINHEILLRRLSNLGVNGISHKLFKNYLTNRRQGVYINGYMSQIKQTNYGVPQGSVLSGLLFVLYMDPLLQMLHSSHQMYIDDLIIYKSFHYKDVNVASRTVTSDCNIISKWCCQNGILLNTGKTKAAMFGTKCGVEKVKDDVKVYLNEERLTYSDSIKYLGVILDQNLSLEEHCTAITKKCSCLLFRIARVKKLLTERTLKCLVDSLVISRIMHGGPVLSLLNERNIKKLQSIQNFAIKIIDKRIINWNLKPVYNRLKVLRVKDLISERIILASYKAINGIYPLKFKILFERRRNIIGTRMNLRYVDRMQIPRSNSALSSKRFSVVGPVKWNELTLATKLSNSYRDFRLKVKAELFDKAQ